MRTHGSGNSQHMVGAEFNESGRSLPLHHIVWVQHRLQRRAVNQPFAAGVGVNVHAIDVDAGQLGLMLW